MPRRRFSDTLSGAFTGAGTGIMATGGHPVGASAGAGLGAIGGYFASMADEPFVQAEIEKMKMDSRIGMEKLTALEDANVERRRKQMFRKGFASRLGRGFGAAMRAGRGFNLAGV